MSKIAVVFWSGTGNTEAMANAIADGAKSSGADVTLFQASEFSSDKVNEFSAIAFGCPAMGAEELEDGEFEPMFDSVKPSLSGKKVALFGSYDWGDGEWLRLWSDDCEKAGCIMAADPLMVHNTPEDSDILECQQFGKELTQ